MSDLRCVFCCMYQALRHSIASMWALWNSPHFETLQVRSKVWFERRVWVCKHSAVQEKLRIYLNKDYSDICDIGIQNVQPSSCVQIAKIGLFGLYTQEWPLFLGISVRTSSDFSLPTWFQPPLELSYISGGKPALPDLWTWSRPSLYLAQSDWEWAEMYVLPFQTRSGNCSGRRADDGAFPRKGMGYKGRLWQSTDTNSQAKSSSPARSRSATFRKSFHTSTVSDESLTATNRQSLQDVGTASIDFDCNTLLGSGSWDSEPRGPLISSFSSLLCTISLPWRPLTLFTRPLLHPWKLDAI